LIGAHLGVPPPKASGSSFPLQVLAGFVPQPPAGFPLQSLTRVILFLGICLSGCDNGEDASRLRLTVDKGVFAVGDTVRGAICVTDPDAVFTQYFIISETDTIRLPLERGTKCAAYEVFLGSVGTKQVHGYAQMEMSNHKVLIEHYSITHHVE
jgi:hypothetical protein